MKRIKNDNEAYREKKEDMREREETREQGLGDEGFQFLSRRRTLVGITEKWRQRRKERQADMLEEQTIRPMGNQLGGEEEEQL